MTEISEFQIEMLKKVYVPPYDIAKQITHRKQQIRDQHGSSQLIQHAQTGRKEEGKRIEISDFDVTILMISTTFFKFEITTKWNFE